MARQRGDSLTGDLLNWERPKVDAGFAPDAIRGSRLASQISQAVALALKSSELSRADIAARMSVELGYAVSENMLANYASEGAEGHKITLERFIALIEVTGCIDLLGFVAGRFGQVVVDQKYRSLINIHLAQEVKRKVEQFEAAETARWQASR